MKDFVLELCERKQYAKTMKLLGKKPAKCDSLRSLENFILFIKKRNEAKSRELTNKLSFEVRYSIFGRMLTRLFQINIDEEDTKVHVVKANEIFKERG